MTTLLCIKNLLKHNRSSVVKVTEENQKTLKFIVEKKESYKDDTILKIIFDINNLIFV